MKSDILLSIAFYLMVVPYVVYKMFRIAWTPDKCYYCNEVLPKKCLDMSTETTSEYTRLSHTSCWFKYLDKEIVRNEQVSL